MDARNSVRNYRKELKMSVDNYECAESIANDPKDLTELYSGKIKAILALTDAVTDLANRMESMLDEIGSKMDGIDLKAPKEEKREGSLR